MEISHVNTMKALKTHAGAFEPLYGLRILGAIIKYIVYDTLLANSLPTRA